MGALGLPVEPQPGAGRELACRRSSGAQHPAACHPAPLASRGLAAAQSLGCTDIEARSTAASAAHACRPACTHARIGSLPCRAHGAPPEVLRWFIDRLTGPDALQRRAQVGSEPGQT